MNLFNFKKLNDQSSINYIKYIILGRHIKVKSFESYLKNKKLIIADVGSTGGLSFLWNGLNKIILCYSFDPDSRAMDLKQKNVKIFPVALWSSEKKLSLNLTKFPDASSLYPPNDNLLSLFMNYDLHNVEKKIMIKTKTMDQVCCGYDLPDFIKLDAEGADLEILKGSKNCLKNSCIGIQTEVQFLERNLGSPIFDKTNKFLQKQGFWLMDLKKESWIRNNSFYRVNSKPQLIWGDAIYMLTSHEMLKRGSKLQEIEREVFLLKMILISLIYGFHDYAIQNLDLFQQENLINNNSYINLENILKDNIDSNMKVISIKLAFLFFSTITLIILYCFPKLRKKALNFWKFSFISFNSTIMSMLTRNGNKKESVGDTSF